MIFFGRWLTGPVLMLGAASALTASASGGTPSSRGWASPAQAGVGVPARTAQAGPGPGGVTARRRKKPSRSRPGCGQYCNQAGGLGAGPGPKHPRLAIRIQSRRTRLTSDGAAIPIVLKCQFRQACRGRVAVSLAAGGAQLGASDLLLGAHRRVSLEVVLTPVGRQALAAQGAKVRLSVVADATQTSGIAQAHGRVFVASRAVTLLRSP